MNKELKPLSKSELLRVKGICNLVKKQIEIMVSDSYGDAEMRKVGRAYLVHTVQTSMGTVTTEEVNVGLDDHLEHKSVQFYHWMLYNGGINALIYCMYAFVWGWYKGTGME